MKNLQKISSILIVFTAVILLTPGISRAQQNTGQLFEKAVFAEEVKGNLTEAVKLYQQVLETKPDNRQLAAKAMLHMGICYEKLGLEQARQTYRDVVNKFSEQEKEVALAKERIDRLEAYAADLSRKAELCMKKGNELFKRWEYESAIKEYENAVKLNPNSLLALNARYCIGQSWFRAGKYDAALATFTKLTEENPESSIAPVSELMVAQVRYAVENNKKPDLVKNYIDENSIVSEQGITYNKIKSFTGKNDVIVWAPGTALSPNGKFLMKNNMIIPMDGSGPYEFIDMQINAHSWSPDGKKIAFTSGDSSIYTVPISPETGRTEGPAKELMSRNCKLEKINWSPDSKKLFFNIIDYQKENYWKIWSMSVLDGIIKPLTNEPTLQGAPICSPDGTAIAFTDGNANIWLCPAEGGTAKKLIDRRHTYPTWSPDGKWLFSDETIKNWGRALNFIRLSDKKEFKVDMPLEVGSYLSWPSESSKLLFFRSSYEMKWGMKVASSSGGPSFEPVPHLPVYGAQWSKNSKSIMIEGDDDRKESDVSMRIIPLAGGESFPLNLDVDEFGNLSSYFLSRDEKYLFFKAEKKDGIIDLYLVSVSIDENRVTGPAVRIIENWSFTGRSIAANLSWSPNGNKIAIIHKEDIWVFNPERRELIQITKSPEKKSRVHWSPDGSMLSFWGIVDEPNMKIETHIIPSVGGDPITILKDCTLSGWSPDSKFIAAKSDRKLFIRDIETDETRIILDLNTHSLDDINNLDWSPDGKNLVLVGYEKTNPEKKDRIYKIPAKGGELTELAIDDITWKYDVSWSPDGKWISYCYYKTEKVRPESTIWEADFEEIKEKLAKNK